MEISYSFSSYLLYSLQLSSRHLQAFAATESTVQDLWDNQVIQFVSDVPITLLGRLRHLIWAALDLTIIGIIADRYFNNKSSLPPNLDAKVKGVIEATPQFNAYIFKGSQDTHLTDLDVRPSNLFFKELFDGDPTTQPGSGNLFAFLQSAAEIRKQIFAKYDDEVITVSAKGKKANLYNRSGGKTVLCGNKDLTDYLGENNYKISAGEIKAMLDSQRIHVSPLIPKYFYLEMKKALKADNVVELPGNDQAAISLAEIISTSYPAPKSPFSPFKSKTPPPKDSLYYVSEFLKRVEKDPKGYGFIENGTMLPFSTIKSLTLYQLGSMIVKTEDYRTFVGEGYCIMKREVDAEDEIMLISACGIRGFHKTTSVPGNEHHELDFRIMKHTFKTSLEAVGKDGYAVFPAVGMGVWGGDPAVYWKAFLEAVIESGTDLGKIFVNPGHQKTPNGSYSGYTGQEFDLLLREYALKHPSNPNLRKIVNLYRQRTDLLLLANNLKKADPKRTVAIFNASDPDVTLGDHVGEYVNNLCHPSTTEENFAAAGTSGLGFERITRVLDYKNRIIQP